MIKFVAILIVLMMIMNFTASGIIDSIKEKFLSDSGGESYISRIFTGEKAHHDISDIITVSMYCGHMDRSYSYAFSLTKDKEKWLFEAECFIKDHQVETAFSDRPVSDEDIKELFEILESNETIAYAETYKKPKKLPFEVMDETIYGFCLIFSDGSRYDTDSAGSAINELEVFFYRLAEKSQ